MSYLTNPYMVSPAGNITDQLKAYYLFGDSGTQHNTATAVGSSDAIPSSDVTLYGSTTDGNSGHVSGVDSIYFPTHDLHGNYATSTNSASDYDFLVVDGDAVWSANWWLKCDVVSGFRQSDWWGCNGNGAGNDIQLRYGNPNQNFTIWFAGNEVKPWTTMNDTAWHMYSLTWDEPSGVATFQIDDNTAITKTSITTSNTSSPPDPIRWGDTSGSEFEGYIQCYALWNRIISADEIITLWNGGAGTTL